MEDTARKLQISRAIIFGRQKYIAKFYDYYQLGMKNADFVTIDRNERLTILSFATIILLFTYSLKPFLPATKEGYEWLFARELAKSEYMCRISCGTVGKETNCQPLQQKAMWSGSLLNFRCQTPP